MKPQPFFAGGFFVLRLLLVVLAGLPSLAAMAQSADVAIAGPAETLVLGASDQIEVNIDSYPELKTTTRVGADGNVVLPLIGIVRLGDLDTRDAATVIAARYRDGGFIKSPKVRIEIVDYQSRRVSVLGAVNRQGLVMLDRKHSLAEILAKVGGLSSDAGDTAVIVRPRADGSSERLTIELGQLGAGGGATALTEVRAGDVVMVPKASTFSVIGAVSRAGTYPLKSRMTVEQAIAAAGDISQFGSRSRLKLRRTDPSTGNVQEIKVKPDDMVKPDDIIVVAERLF